MDYACALQEARANTLQLIAAVGDDDFRQQAHADFSPLGWHLGHVGVVESFWIRQRCQDQPSLSPFYDFFFTPTENPKPERVQLPPREEIVTYLHTVREQTLQFLAQATFHTEDALLHNGNIFSMLLQHEEQHYETMLVILQLLGASCYEAAYRAGTEVTSVRHFSCRSTTLDSLTLTLSQRERKFPSLPPQFVPNSITPEVARSHRIRQHYSPSSARMEPTVSLQGMAHLPATAVFIGSNNLGETLDNERPRHEVKVSAFDIDRWPVTNGEFSNFIEHGGYDEARWWSQEGWQWRQQQEVNHPLYWQKLDGIHWIELDFGQARSLMMERPVRCVSWYEADAYARWTGKRLPTEAEWEYAITSEALHGVGQVWEWTATWFHPYPGFRAHPYDGYSVPYFDQQHRVLRGGAWVTQQHVRRLTFRNWYHPWTRAIFSGFRCAKDSDYPTQSK
jgi:gamma-glutamyl hercynylcysteine S-oxide synthase